MQSDMSRPDRSHPVWCVFLRSLPVGGVERQFTQLVNRLVSRRRVILVTLFRADGRASKLLSGEVQHRALFDLPDTGKTPAWMLLKAPVLLSRLCREEDVGIVYSAREVSNLIAACAARRLPEVFLIWGHRCSAHQFSPRIRILLPLLRMVRGRVDLEIANSEAGLDYYRGMGFCRGRVMRLPNFIDTDHFKPDLDAQARLRESWGIGESERVIGIVGRLAPMKNQRGFVRAAALAAQHLPGVKFFVLGPGPESERRALMQLAEELGLRGRFVIHDAVPMAETAGVFNALDLLCSASLYGEGFSNVLAECLACGTPVVATDVGAAREIVADYGEVVKPGDEQALADAMRRAVESPFDREAVVDHIRQLCDPERILGQLLQAVEGVR